MADGKLVHIVDDEESIRRSLDFLLRPAGFRTERWEDGEAFLKDADKTEPACVLLDVRMPGMDGLQVQAEMAGRGFNMPVVVLTGHGDISTAVRAMQGGAVDFLEKPFNRERLLQALESGFAQIEDREAARKREDWAKTEVAKLTDREKEVLEGLAKHNGPVKQPGWALAELDAAFPLDLGGQVRIAQFVFVDVWHGD